MAVEVTVVVTVDAPIAVVMMVVGALLMTILMPALDIRPSSEEWFEY